jgi:hypothetical protein
VLDRQRLNRFVASESVVPNLSPGAIVWVGSFNSSLPVELIDQWLRAQRVVIANVRFRQTCTSFSSALTLSAGDAG